MTRFDIGKSIMTESLSSRTRRERDAFLDASMSVEEDKRDRASCELSSTIQRRSVITWSVQDLSERRTYFRVRSRSSKFEIRYCLIKKKHHLKKNKKEKIKRKKRVNSDGCAKMCGKRGRRRRCSTSNFESRNSKSKLEFEVRDRISLK